MSDFDTSSTDAMYWAEQFCKHMRDNNWTPEDIDEELMVGWFANYWSACEQATASPEPSVLQEIFNRCSWLDIHKDWDNGTVIARTYITRVGQFEGVGKSLDEAMQALREEVEK